MKRFALVALLAAMLFSIASSASATELKVKGNLDVYGMWSANLRDFDSDNGDADNFYTSQRMRTYFTFQTNENLKAVLGLEMNHIWGQGGNTNEGGAGWGTDGRDNIRVKHAYLDFMFPDTKVNVKAGLQAIKLPGVFGNPVFDDDAAALVVSAPINDMFGVAVGYTRGVDNQDNYDDAYFTNGTARNYNGSDDLDMFFVAVPVKLDGFSATPYFAYATAGENVGLGGALLNANADRWAGSTGEADIWVLGANAQLTMFDPLTFAADLIYGQGENDDYETKGWYAALAASYKMDMMTATLFGTYATGADDDADEDNYLPTLRENWNLTPYIGGARAFNTSESNLGYATGTLGVGRDGTGLWSVGLILDKITFVDNLSHKLIIAYAEGTSDKDAGETNWDEKDSAWEVYFVNKYMLYENLAAINELGYFAPSLKGQSGEDDSYFATIGFQYNF
jgi:hypothetical protein